MITIHKDNFESEVLGSAVPVVADFWAPWCGYCRRLAPVIERLEKEYGDRVKFVKIDTDDNASLADEYSVDTIPTLILFRGGEARNHCESCFSGNRRGLVERKRNSLTEQKAWTREDTTLS